MAGLDGEVHLNVTEATRRVFRGLGRFSFLRKLYDMARSVKKVKRLYKEYPVVPEEIACWKAEVKEAFEHSEKAFGSFT